jgi:conjugal transfer ATP-binding protein TraC
MFKPSDIKKQEKDIAQAEEKKEKLSFLKKQEKQEKEVKEERILIEEERAFRRGVVTIKDIIAPSSFEVKPAYVRLGDKYTRTLFIIEYPRYISIGWFSPIINFSATVDISMFFVPIDASIVLKQLRDKSGNLEAQLVADAEKGAPRDPLRETALRDVEKLRDDLTQGIEHFFQYSLYITIYADTPKELENLTEEIEGILGSKLVLSKRVLYQAEEGFNSSVPLGDDQIGIPFNMNSSPVASSFPFMSSELTSDDGILYGINRHNNSLILFDRFSLQNANMVVFATSGAGKSYAVKLEILRSMMFGTDVIIIDPEKEYEHLSESVGGTYLNISLNSPVKINPFDLPRSIGEDMKTGDIIRSAVITLKGMMRLMLGDLTHQEDSLIDRALIETYAKKDITSESDLNDVEPPLLQDLQEVLEGMEGADDLVLRIKKYTEGTFSGLFNNYTNVDMRNQLVVFSVRDLEDELKPVAIYTIVNYIWNVVRSELKRRILTIDEAWWLMQREDSAKFIFALVKRCRKYYLGVTTITQDVNDFLVSPYGQAIVNNSSLQLLFKQTTSAIDVIQKTFMLTEGERYLLLECGVGEGIFFAGKKHAAIKIVASYTEDQIITSDPRQLLEIEEAKKEYEDEVIGSREKEKEKEKEDEIPSEDDLDESQIQGQ